MAAPREFGWERFLTERDKAHIAATWTKTALFGFGDRPALLIVDAYYAAVGTAREPLLESIKNWPMSCGLEGWAAIDRTVPLLAAAREAGVPVIYMTDLDGFPSPWGRGNRKLTDADLRARRHPRAKHIVDEIAPLDGELVLGKAAPSAFSGTALQFHLNYLRVDTIVVAGETTSGCIRATVVDGATHRYRMGVVVDCCFDRTEASHYMSLYDMHQKYADVVPATDAIEYFRTTGPTAK